MEWSVNGWIDHDGKGMPVDGDTIVRVRCRDDIEASPLPASDFLGSEEGFNGDWWNHQGKWFDIVAYKVEDENENPS